MLLHVSRIRAPAAGLGMSCFWMRARFPLQISPLEFNWLPFIKAMNHFLDPLVQPGGLIKGSVLVRNTRSNLDVVPDSRRNLSTAFAYHPTQSYKIDNRVFNDRMWLK